MMLILSVLLLVYVHVGRCSAMEIMTKPVVFGDTVELQCNLTECKTCSTGQQCEWTGGQNYTLLTMNGKSRNPSKYKMVMKDSSPSSYLEIYNFSETDIGIDYTCTCGFADVTKNLSVHQDDVLLLPCPHLTHDTSKIVDDILLINVTLQKVNPVPSCSVYNGKEIIMDHLNFTAYSSGLFYKAKFERFILSQEFYCEEPFKIECTAASKSVTIVNKYLQNCGDERITHFTVYWPVLVLIVILILVAVLLYKQKRAVHDCRQAFHKKQYNVSYAANVKHEEDDQLKYKFDANDNEIASETTNLSNIKIV